MATKEQSYMQLFAHWDIQRISEEQIPKELESKGYSESEILEISALYKKKRQDEKQKKGFVLMGIGSVLGFLSCVFTMLDIVPELRGITLYGLTTFGVSTAFVGAYFVFE